MRKIPPSSEFTIPVDDVGAENVLAHFQQQLKGMDFGPELLQDFKEIGNLIVFLNLCNVGLVPFDSLLQILMFL